MDRAINAIAFCIEISFGGLWLAGKMMMKGMIYPVPRKMAVTKERVRLAECRRVILPSPCSRRLRERIEAGVKRMSACLNQELQLAPALPQAGMPFVVFTLLKRGIPDQGYRLLFTNQVRCIEACSEAGFFYGLQALVQWVEAGGSKIVSITIEDEPAFDVRGVMLDVSRCKVPTMATCKQVIDKLAGLRINQLQLYIEHTFAFSAHKTVWADASPFTPAEIMELDQYCSDRFIQLVPNLNSFGHVERWLRHPAYRHLAECPDMEACSTLAPNRASLRFLEELYAEYLPSFSSPLFNVGCDETWELGKGRSKRRAAKIGTTAVYLDFLKKIHALVSKQGKQMQFWGDLILRQPAFIEQLPKDLIALNWGYEANHPFETQCPAFRSAGIEFYVCPGTSAWRSITGRTDNCLANLENAARNGLAHDASGYLITDWGDAGHHQVLPISYVGFTAGAGLSWNLDRNKDVDLAGVISRHFFDDPTGRSGKFLLDLGRTPNRIKGIDVSNQSAIHRLLFVLHKPEELSKVTVSELSRAQVWLDKLETDLSALRLMCGDGNLVRHELQHALLSARYALQRCQRIKAGKCNAPDLDRALRELVQSHGEQWLTRNRLGGLRESEDILLQTRL